MVSRGCSQKTSKMDNMKVKICLFSMNQGGQRKFLMIVLEMKEVHKVRKWWKKKTL